MNTQTDNDRDEKVSKAYRAYSDEKTPAQLDRAVLREAAAGARKNSWQRFYTWRRPLAFAATLVLGVTLVYDMQKVLEDAGTPYLPEAELMESTAPQLDDVDAAQFAPGELDLQRREEAAPAAPRRNFAPAADRAPAMKMAAPPASSTDANTPESRRDESRERQAAEDRAEPSVSEANALQRRMGTTSSAVTPAAGEATNRCDTEQYDSAETWWRCIQQLRDAGEDARADAELLQLRQQYPEFPALTDPD